MRRTSTVACGTIALAWAVLGASPAAAQFPPAGPYSQVDIQVGAKVFAAQCVVCHGATGNLVAGVDLKSGRFRRATNDGELMEIVTTGIKGTAMPPFSFSPAELTGIIAYLRNMGSFNAATVPQGDAARGKTVFDGAGRCATCHRVNGRGPRLAPDLSDIGSLRTADVLQKTVLDPAGTLQFGTRTVRAITRDGKTVTGRRLNEDTYTVQLIDDQERLVSLTKAELREYRVITQPSMPASRGTLSAQDVTDVVAYLLTLKGLR